MGKFFISSKAQMSAPFELLVAVIIMTFVVIIGTQMLELSQKQVCLSSVDREISKFVINLQNSANNRSVVKFEFRPDNCYNESKTVSKIFLFSDSHSCASRCGLSGIESCFVFVFNSADIPDGFRQKCIAIPAYTTFLGVDDKCDTTGEFSGYLPINPLADGSSIILPGSYVIKNVASAAQTYPELCVYVKK